RDGPAPWDGDGLRARAAAGDDAVVQRYLPDAGPADVASDPDFHVSAARHAQRAGACGVAARPPPVAGGPSIFRHAPETSGTVNSPAPQAPQLARSFGSAPWSVPRVHKGIQPGGGRSTAAGFRDQSKVAHLSGGFRFAGREKALLQGGLGFGHHIAHYLARGLD